MKSSNNIGMCRDFNGRIARMALLFTMLLDLIKATKLAVLTYIAFVDQLTRLMEVVVVPPKI